MLDAADFQAATAILADEQQPEELRTAAEQAVIQHLAEVVQDPEQPPGEREAAMQTLDAAGYGFADEEPAPDPVGALAEQVAAIQQYLAETPVQDYTPAAVGAPEMTPEEYQQAFVEHMDQSLDALEAQQGREFSDAEVRRITMAAIQSANDVEPFPDAQFAAETAAYDHEQATSNRQGRVETMTQDWQERQAEETPLTQEHVDDLQERMEGDNSDDARRARVELMAHQVTGEVGPAEGEGE
jgi:hypothetical protein